MTYPEKGANYSRRPKWLDKAVRAEGGAVDAESDAHPPAEPISARIVRSLTSPPMLGVLPVAETLKGTDPAQLALGTLPVDKVKRLLSGD